MHGRGRLAGAALVVADGDEVGPLAAGQGRGGVLVLEIRIALAEGHGDAADLHHAGAGVGAVGPGHGAGDAQDEPRRLTVLGDAAHDLQGPGAPFLRMSQDVLGEDAEEVGRIVDVVGLQGRHALHQLVEAAALGEADLAVGRRDQRRGGHGGVEKGAIAPASGGTQQGIGQLVQQAHASTEPRPRDLER